MLAEQARLDCAVYELAKKFLLDIELVTEDMLYKHLALGETRKRLAVISEIYKRLIFSATNANRKRNVIGPIERYGPVLCAFEPSEVAQQYSGNWPHVLRDIRTIRDHPIPSASEVILPLFAKSIVSGAGFLANFQSAAEFYDWADFFDHDERARPALPMLLSLEIDGFGFALACDFLKEIGFFNFGKPDVHLKNIFYSLILTSSTNDYAVFKAIFRIANNVGVTSYKVDKLFWLIGSGNFYLDDIKVGNHRNEFISFVKEQIRGIA